MFSTTEATEVTLLCDAELMKAVIDLFGMKVRTKPVGENQFLATVKVCPGPTFYRWVFGWGGRMRIEGPEIVVEHYRTMLQKETENY